MSKTVKKRAQIHIAVVGVEKKCKDPLPNTVAGLEIRNHSVFELTLIFGDQNGYLFKT